MPFRMAYRKEAIMATKMEPMHTTRQKCSSTSQLLMLKVVPSMIPHPIMVRKMCGHFLSRIV